MPSDTRVRRIAERIRNDLAEVLLRSTSDPRLEGVTVTEVEVDRELAYATIYVSALEGEGRREEALQGLKHASGFLRTSLAKRIPLRAFPQLRFRWDESLEQGSRIDALLKAVLDDGQKTDGGPGQG
jgi:ribosome-binding factor A